MADGHSAGGELIQQRADGGRYLGVRAYNQGPFQILSKLANDNLPFGQCGRRGPADLNHGPMPDKREGGIPVGQRSAHDEMIVAVDKNPDHG